MAFFNNGFSFFGDFDTSNFTYTDFRPSDFNIDPNVWDELEYMQPVSSFTYQNTPYLTQPQPEPDWLWQPAPQAYALQQQPYAANTCHQNPPESEEVEITKVTVDLTKEDEGDEPAVYPTPESLPSPPKRRKSYDWLGMPADIETAARENAAKLAIKASVDAGRLRLRNQLKTKKELKEKKKGGQEGVRNKRRETVSKKRKRDEVENRKATEPPSTRVHTKPEDLWGDSSTSVAVTQPQYNEEESQAMLALFEHLEAEMGTKPTKDVT